MIIRVTDADVECDSPVQLFQLFLCIRTPANRSSSPLQDDQTNHFLRILILPAEQQLSDHLPVKVTLEEKD